MLLCLGQSLPTHHRNVPDQNVSEVCQSRQSTENALLAPSQVASVLRRWPTLPLTHRGSHPNPSLPLRLPRHVHVNQALLLLKHQRQHWDQWDYRT